MGKTIDEALAWIHSRLPFGSKPGLARIETLLAQRNHPEKNLPTIHIAGTNGKGSTVSFLKNMLEEAGLVVGTFTSPYIQSFSERIAINGEAISDQEIVKYVTIYRSIVDKMDDNLEVSGTTEFEILTAMALEYFHDQKVDVAIIETGIGGLLDSTNVVHPILTAITTIGIDHKEILGNTVEKIATQKAGIIKKGSAVVTGNLSKEALLVIEEKAHQVKSPIYRYGEEYKIAYLYPDINWGEVFDFYGEMGRIPKIHSSLFGRHQAENAAVAIQLFYLYCQKRGIIFYNKYVYQGLKKTFWPARMERMKQEPLIILDGAHNVQAIKRLAENIQTEFPKQHIRLLFSALNTKDVDEMVSQLKKIPTVHLYLTTFQYPRAIKLKDMTHLLDEQTELISSWQLGLAELLDHASSEDILIITGSLYFVSQVRAWLMEEKEKNEKN